MLNKKSLSVALLASLFAGSFTLAGMANAETEKQKTIEVRAIKDKDVRIVVDDDGAENVIVLTNEELEDEDLLEAKLADLDNDTAETIRQAVAGTKHMFVKGTDISGMHGMHEKVIVINDGEGEHVQAFHFDGGDTMLAGHTDAIVKLIERGEFSQEELDKIQAAVDAKR